MDARILLVDDDRHRRETVQGALKSLGYLAVETADCEDALPLLEGEAYDLILLDIVLRDKRGFRVFDFLKKNLVAGKVIMITGTAGLEDAVKNATLETRDKRRTLYDPDPLLRSIGHVLSDRSPADLKVQIIKAGDFIRSTPAGDLDIKGSTEGLEQIASLGADLQQYTVLIDLRDVTSRLSTADIYELASKLGIYGDTFRRKTAVLVRTDKGIDQAAFFRNVAHNRGFNVNLFTVFEDAILWLASDTQTPRNQTRKESPTAEHNCFRRMFQQLRD